MSGRAGRLMQLTWRPKWKHELAASSLNVASSSELFHLGKLFSNYKAIDAREKESVRSHLIRI